MHCAKRVSIEIIEGSIETYFDFVGHPRCSQDWRIASIRDINRQGLHRARRETFAGRIRLATLHVGGAESRRSHRIVGVCQCSIVDTIVALCNSKHLPICGLRMALIAIPVRICQSNVPRISNGRGDMAT